MLGLALTGIHLTRHHDVKGIKKNALDDWLLMLQGKEPGEKQRRKDSALSNWLLLL